MDNFPEILVTFEPVIIMDFLLNSCEMSNGVKMSLSYLSMEIHICFGSSVSQMFFSA